MSDRPIGDHALIADSHSCALVDRAGSVEWLCFPRFDSPAVFARLLDSDGGHFSLRPRGEFRAHRGYLEGTLVTVILTFRNDSAAEQSLTFEAPLEADTGPVDPGERRDWREPGRGSRPALRRGTRGDARDALSRPAARRAAPLLGADRPEALSPCGCSRCSSALRFWS